MESKEVEFLSVRIISPSLFSYLYFLGFKKRTRCFGCNDRQGHQRGLEQSPPVVLALGDLPPDMHVTFSSRKTAFLLKLCLHHTLRFKCCNSRILCFGISKICETNRLCVGTEYGRLARDTFPFLAPWGFLVTSPCP